MYSYVQIVAAVKGIYYNIIIRPLARLIQRGGGMHVKIIMQASGYTTYNLMCFKLSILVLKYLHHTRL